MSSFACVTCSRDAVVEIPGRGNADDADSARSLRVPRRLCLLHFCVEGLREEGQEGRVLNQDGARAQLPEVQKIVGKLWAGVFRGLRRVQKRGLCATAPTVQAESSKTTTMTKTDDKISSASGREVPRAKKRTKTCEEAVAVEERKDKELEALSPSDRMREKHRSLLRRYLSTARRRLEEAEGLKTTNAEGVSIDALVPNIERCMYNKWVTEDNILRPGYQNSLRTIYSNLRDKRNNDFPRRIFSGIYKASDLCTLRAADMASDRMKREREEMEEQIWRQTVVSDSGTQSTEYTCRACGGTKTHVVSTKVTGRQCTKSETWGRKDEIDTLAVVTCDACSRSWEIKS